MAWRWTKLGENVGDERVVRQLHEFACGAACVAMLLRTPDAPQVVARRLFPSRLPLRVEAELVTQLDEARERLGLKNRVELFRRSLVRTARRSRAPRAGRGAHRARQAAAEGRGVVPVPT